MKGASLIKGLGITFKKFFEKKITAQYPEVKPELPENSHGSFKFEAEKCTSCTLCELACPNKVIKVEYSKNENNRRVLDRYNMNLGYCMFCGFCVEACQSDAINFSSVFELTADSRKGTLFSWDGVKSDKNDGNNDGNKDGEQT